ncbi:MAG: hypothetical protein AAF198_06675 [Pseudomonadota bacterium]
MSDAIRSFEKEGTFLIGCLTHEKGAIADRNSEGAIVVGQVNSWSILQVPE